MNKTKTTVAKISVRKFVAQNSNFILIKSLLRASKLKIYKLKKNDRTKVKGYPHWFN